MSSTCGCKSDFALHQRVLYSSDCSVHDNEVKPTLIGFGFTTHATSANDGLPANWSCGQKLAKVKLLLVPCDCLTSRGMLNVSTYTKSICDDTL